MMHVKICQIIIIKLKGTFINDSCIILLLFSELRFELLDAAIIPLIGMDQALCGFGVVLMMRMMLEEITEFCATDSHRSTRILGKLLHSLFLKLLRGSDWR